MAENKYEEELAKLVLGEVSELVVEKGDFFLFREAWREHPDRDKIVGEAFLYGKIIYRFKS
ncbi:hypothetical protein [Vagococcus acidifermentans]|uniref:Uncharacterized protein n=1 Tax=Vagococcus acidifermentans TaxID=564710 RepID=A0A430AVG2_9ENTE|nr:hypothetical protein [Vagococcus acidifermentans]RSU12042.1 hypothetical protein CBF27_06345 [Vagococcus acidifermentans]